MPLKKTFDNRTVEDPNLREFYPQKFDFDQYEPYTGDRANFKAAELTKNTLYAKNHPVNKRKMFEAMSVLVKDQIDSELDARFKHIPDFMRSGNKHAFNQFFLENPKFQNLLAGFQHQLEKIIKDEVTINSTQLELFMQHPRSRTLEKPNLIKPYSKFQESKRERAMVQQGIDQARDKFNYR